MEQEEQKKKQKAAKVSQRGPGVAELEKILREKNKKEDDNNAFVEMIPLLDSSLPQSFPAHFPQLPPFPRVSNPLPVKELDHPSPYSQAKHAPLAPNIDAHGPISLPLLTLFGNNASGTKLDSGFTFPTQIPDSSDPVWISHLPQQGKKEQCPYSMANFRYSAGLDLQIIEPPSNQNTVRPEKENASMAGVKKRPWLYSVERHHQKASSLHDDINRRNQSSPFHSQHSKTASRTVKKRGLFELKSQSCTASDGDFLTLSPPSSVRSSMQGRTHNPCQKQGSSGSVRQLTKDETILSLNRGRVESGEDSIDLNLKL